VVMCHKCAKRIIDHLISAGSGSRPNMPSTDGDIHLGWRK